MSSVRPKAFLKQAKPKKKHEQKLETVDDYQAAGVDHEDAAGKWRAGDSSKSYRFFVKAIDVYSQGLQKFPRSLDLAYNKARVELEIATHPILIPQLQVPVLDALRTALLSHQYALDLEPNNPDTLFNTSQVLTSIAEEIAKSDDLPDTEALQCLEQALEYQNQCLSIQELKYEESVQQRQIAEQQPPVVEDIDDEQEEDGGIRLGSDTNSTDKEEEQWASIVEPVTEDTLIDTVLAQLGTLTTLCGILSSSPESASSTTLAWVEEYSTKLLKEKIPAYLQQKEMNRNESNSSISRKAEIGLARANFVSSLLEAGYRASKIDAQTYKQERDSTFTAPEVELESTFDALVANARSLIVFSSTIMEGFYSLQASTSAAQQEMNALARLCWTALGTAVNSSLTASRLQPSKDDASNLATTHFLRGDISLLQYRLSLPPVYHQQAQDNAAQLLKNAEVFYRNANKLFPSSEIESKTVASFRSAVVMALTQSESGKINMVSIDTAGSIGKSVTEEWKRRQIDDMVDEGLLNPELTS